MILNFSLKMSTILGKKQFKVGDIFNLKNIYEFNTFLDKHNYKDDKFTYETLSCLQESVHTARILLINLYHRKTLITNGLVFGERVKYVKTKSFITFIRSM